VFEPQGSQRDAASTIFNLPDYRVIDVREEVDGLRCVVVESTAPPGCPSCGVVATRGGATRVHARREQVVRDVPVGGLVRVVWAKRRWRCTEDGCSRATLWESTLQFPARARCTRRLRGALVDAVVVSGRAAAQTARAFAASWWSMHAALAAVVVLLPAVDDIVARRLGVDQHRYPSVRFFRDPDGRWRPFEPGGTSRVRGRMTTFVDLATGQVLGVVDGRDSAAVSALTCTGRAVGRGVGAGQRSVSGRFGALIGSLWGCRGSSGR
jgi:transposase